MTEQAAPLPEQTPPRSEWGGIVVRSIVALVVLVGGYVALAYYLGDRIPSGTTVDAANIGGLNRENAEEVLVDDFEEITVQPVVIELSGESIELDPAEIGLVPDYADTLDGVTGLTLDPRNLWAQLSGQGRELELSTTVDEEMLTAALNEVAPELVQVPLQAKVVLAQGEVKPTMPEAGVELDVEGTVEAISNDWPRELRIEGASVAIEPDVSAEDVDEFIADYAEPALSDDITVKADDATAAVTPTQISRVLTVVQDGSGPGEGSLRLVQDDEELLDIVNGNLSDVVKEPRDATVKLSGGSPKIVNAVVGSEVDEAGILSGAREVLQVEDAPSGDQAGATTDAPEPSSADEGDPKVDGRRITVEVSEVKPKISNADADGWEMTQMAEFTSEMPTGAANADRTENIRVGLGHVNGAVVMPGETFSLGDALAPITPERGYVEAGVIDSGRLVKGIGGGLSQVSTTLLNTAWFAGVQLDEFTPHSYYISRYPVGREATIAIGVIDNKFTNDTDTPIIIETYLQGDSIYMQFWGDRQYSVDTTTGSRYNITQPETFTDNSAECLTQGAVEGFTVNVNRTLSQSGSVVSDRDYTTTYQPSPGVTCTG
ncbi:VanW family protein [Ornithinimicrobium sp. Arc0846-15]|nr:VanW family protein [Ornithinimicrobium laminariae]